MFARGWTVGGFRNAKNILETPHPGHSWLSFAFSKAHATPRGTQWGWGAISATLQFSHTAQLNGKKGSHQSPPPPVRTGHVSCPDFSTIDLSPSTFLCLSCILSPSQMSSTLGRGVCLSIEEGSFLSTPPSETLGKPQELLHPQQAPALHNSALKRLRPTGTSPSSPPAGRRGAVPQQRGSRLPLPWPGLTFAKLIAKPAAPEQKAIRRARQKSQFPQ